MEARVKHAVAAAPVVVRKFWPKPMDPGIFSNTR
jgi:hypothetical protein